MIDFARTSDFYKMFTVFFLFSYLIVVRTVGAFFYASVFFYLADLHTHHRIHVKTGQLSGLDYGHAHLEVLRFERVLSRVQLIFVFYRSRKKKKKK